MEAADGDHACRDVFATDVGSFSRVSHGLRHTRGSDIRRHLDALRVDARGRACRCPASFSMKAPSFLAAHLHPEFLEDGDFDVVLAHAWKVVLDLAGQSRLSAKGRVFALASRAHRHAQ